MLSRSFVLPPRGELRLTLRPLPTGAGCPCVTYRISPIDAAANDEAALETDAEVFGTELLANVDYQFIADGAPRSLCISTVKGCRVVLQVHAVLQPPLAFVAAVVAIGYSEEERYQLIRSLETSQPLAASAAAPTGDASAIAADYVKQVTAGLPMWTPAVGVGTVCLSPTGHARNWKGVVDLHHVLNVLRRKARGSADGVAGGGLGPRVVVCSSRRDCGKSTLCRVLANYAVRSGYHPLLLNTDPEAPFLGLPGVISATTAQFTFDPEEEACFVPQLHFWYGATDPRRNAPMYRRALLSAIEAAEERTTRYDRCRFGGAIVDTPTVDADAAGNYQSESVANLRFLIEQIGAETVIIIGCERLRNALRASFVDQAPEHNANPPPASATTFGTAVVSQGGMTVRLWVVPPLSGCAVRLPLDRATLIRAKWRQYFYGTPTSPLTPAVVTISLDDVRLVSLNAVSHKALAGLLPLSDDGRDTAGVSSPATSYEGAEVENSNGTDLVVSDIRPEDMDLRDRIVGLSSAIPDPQAIAERRLLQQFSGGADGADKNSDFVDDIAIRDSPIAAFFRVIGIVDRGTKLAVLAARSDIVVLRGMAVLVPVHDDLVISHL